MPIYFEGTMADKPQRTWTVARREDGGYSFRDPKGEERARFATADKMAEHFAMLLEHNDHLRHENGLLRACRRIDPTVEVTGEHVRTSQADALKMLVRCAWEHVEISTGRAAEILGMGLVDLREIINTEGWQYKDEKTDEGGEP